MFSLQKPTIDKIEIYDECISSVQNIDKRKELSDYKDIYLLNADNYDYYASKKDLYTLNSVPIAIENENFVRYETIKDDLKNLYDKLRSNKKPRLYYDEIRSLANKCPFCGFGYIYTLDHYLPKSYFPIFSILPYNLVPCCRDCNTNKGNKYATSVDLQTLHPYYDGDILSKRLVFAEILEQNPMSIIFYIKHTDKICENRVKTHFQVYELPKRFAVEAVGRINGLNIKFMMNNITANDIKQELYAEFKASEKISLNSWQTAMYEALYQSDWYCQEGYKQKN